MRRVWQDHFVEENNLTFNVKMLRRALGDNAQNPRFIETVPRRGYRFIAEVKEIFHENGEKSQADKISPPPPPPPPPRKSYALFAVLGIFLLSTLTAGSWLARKQFFAAGLNAPILSAPFHSEKFSASGKVKYAVISPDGKLVAFTDETAGKYGIWLRRLESSENIQIVSPSPEFYGGLAFAHDGQSLFFMQKRRGESVQSAIYRVSISGGVPEKIIEDAEGWISLSPDDRQISFVHFGRKDNDDYCSLMIADVDGGNVRKILTRPRPIRITDNQFSPDGKRIAFAFGQSYDGGSDFHLALVGLESGSESEISPQTFFEIENMKWLPGGDELLLTAKEALDGKSKIWQVSTATGEAQPLTKDATSYLSISVSNDASRMIATQLGNDFRLYLSAAGETKVLTAAREATFAPTGKIIYATDEGYIWTINRDGGEQRQLTNREFKDFSPRVAPDGGIYFASNRSGTNQVWRMNADGGYQTQLTKTEGGYPRFVSPDGRWVYYESGLHQTLWKIAADGGEEVRVSEGKIYSPAFSPDGNFVAHFVREKDGRVKIYVMNLENPKILKTFVPAAEISYVHKIGWSNDNKTINYVTDENSKNYLWQQSLDGGKPRFVADLGDKQIEDFALAPDGENFAFIGGEWLHDAVLIDGLK